MNFSKIPHVKVLGIAGITAALAVNSGCKPLNSNQPGNPPSPNIVFILCDDLGYGDIGVFGAADIQTPHIDYLAESGIQFTDFYSASSVCSPSRAALLTGRYPQRMGINGVFFPESHVGMPEHEITMADMLREQGYATGLFGKWHLGHMYQYLPLQRGFDEYFGMPYSNDMASAIYIRGNDVYQHEVDQRYSTRVFTEEALYFMERNRKNRFFALISYTMPHVPLYVSEEFEGSSNRGLYGDVIQEIDWGVGQVLEKLRELSIIDNTLIIFTSDNGPWLVMRDHGGLADPLKEGKFYTFEGGMRVPTVAMWKKQIPPGTVAKDMATMMDWFPTFAGLAGGQIPGDRSIDGHDISSVLTSGTNPEERGFLYFDNAELQGYRQGDWKIKLPYEGFPGAAYKHRVDPHELMLINLREDPSEQHNLADLHPDVLDKMTMLMDSAFNSLGKLPPSITIRTPADQSHFDYLIKEYGEKFYLLEDVSN